MIIEDVFKEFAEVVGENRKYEISLLDEDGYIIQTTLKDLPRTQVQNRINSDTQVFFPLHVDGTFYGILMVQGENMNTIAPLIRDSLVTRIRFELQQARINNQMSNGERFVRMLIDPFEFDAQKVIHLCEILNVRTDSSRLCIYMVSEKGFQSDKINNLDLIPDKEVPVFSLMNAHELVIFKALSNGNMEKEFVEAWVKEYLQSAKRMDIVADKIYVSMPCQKIHEYHYSFEACKWLKEHIIQEDKFVFMCDHLYEYFLDAIKPSYIARVFDERMLANKNIDKDELIEIATHMTQADFSINKTAQDMYIHKNTLIYKLKKYEDALGIDITGSTKGRVVFTLVAMELLDEKKKRNLGL